MRRVLVITTHFAPDIHVGAKRMNKFAKHLSFSGWQPAVLTREVQYYHTVDESVLDQLAEDMRVHEWSIAPLLA